MSAVEYYLTLTTPTFIFEKKYISKIKTFVTINGKECKINKKYYFLKWLFLPIGVRLRSAF